MPKTHLRFKNFRPAALDAGNNLFEAKPWRLSDNEEIQAVAEEFATRVCAAYSVPQVTVQVVDDPYVPVAYTPAIVRENGLGQIESVQAPTIRMGRWSIVSFFTVMRTHLLANGAEQHADDPNAWAHSLFYTLKPAMFRKRVREGRIQGLSAKDTFSRATWEKLVEFGVGNDYTGGLICEPDEVGGILQQIAAGTLTAVRTDPVPPSVEEFIEDDLDDEDEYDSDEFTDEGERMELELGALEGDHPELESTVLRPSEAAMAASDDGLDALGIVALRQLSRGVVSGGYSMSKPALVAALRNAGVRA